MVERHVEAVRVAGPNPAETTTPASANGRPAVFEIANLGSIPRAGTMLPVRLMVGWHTLNMQIGVRFPDREPHFS